MEDRLHHGGLRVRLVCAVVAGDLGEDPVVLFLHKYLPVGDKNGDGIAFGKAELSWPDEASCGNGLLRMLNERQNIVAMFVGHGHKNVIEVIEFPSGHQVIQSDPGNWRLLEFGEREIVISFSGSTQAEFRIPLQEN